MHGSRLIFRFVYLCRLLNTAQGSLLDDEQLVNTLQSSKTTSMEVTEQLEISEQTEIKIDTAREVGKITTTPLKFILFLLGISSLCSESFYTVLCYERHGTY